MARHFDTHVVAATYRTARYAERALKHWREHGWHVGETDDPKTIHVRTYKPTVLFGPLGATIPKRRPLDGACYAEATAWERGLVSWSLACGCGAWRLESDTRARGIVAELQPTGRGGAIFQPPATYVVERIEWPCVNADDRASVAVRLPDEDGWRGRVVFVPESAAVALLPDLTSAQRQCYVDTRDIPDVADTFPMPEVPAT